MQTSNPERKVAVWINRLMGSVMPESEALKYFNDEKDYYGIAINRGDHMVLDNPKICVVCKEYTKTPICVRKIGLLCPACNDKMF